MRRFLRAGIWLCLAGLLVLPLRAAEAFSDVPEGYWAEESIRSFAQQGIVSGYGDGTFRPDETVTREQFCTILVSAFRQELDFPEAASFADVPKDRWSYPFVETCREFLTGYENPFGRLPMFHPDAAAAREDIAVALVRMLGYRGEDVREERLAERTFTDAGQISPGLRGYVDLALELDLVSGYPDGTFRPQNGITRAEAVTLIDKATKRAAYDVSTELFLDAELTYSADGRTVTLRVETEPGTTVLVNNSPLPLSRTLSERYAGELSYTFQSEGSQDFEIFARRREKIRYQLLSAYYIVGEPELTVYFLPEQTETDELTLTGAAQNDSPLAWLEINGALVSYFNSAQSPQPWSYPVTLQEGMNYFDFKLTNDAGKSTEEHRAVELRRPAGEPPEVQWQYVPAQSRLSEVTLTGRVLRGAQGVRLFVNGQQFPVEADGLFSVPCPLSPGENVFQFYFLNQYGEEYTEDILIERES